MILKLSEIFIPEPGKCIYSTEELFALELRPAFLKDMACRLHLMYKENHTSESNLCFADSKKVRPEYRTTFRKADVVRCMAALFPARVVDMEHLTVSLPDTAASFWALVESGKCKI